MNFRKLLIPLLIVLIPLLFFYKTLFFQKIPFPGDLLLGNYEPYKSDTSLGYGLGGVPHKGQGADVIRELYPWKHFSIEQIKQGVFPLWNPYTFSGNPHFANLQSGTLYPVNILFFVLPFVSAWSIYIIFQYVLLLTFTYFYLRQIELKKIPSLFGSIAFSFCAFLTVWGEYGNIGHSLAFLPLAFFSIEKTLKSNKWYWYVLLIFSCVFSIFAGYIQLTMYMYLLICAYLLTRYLSFKKKNKRTYLFIVFSLGAGLLISAVQILPLYEFLQYSLRANYSYKDLGERLLPPQSTLTLLVADFFGNPATRNYFLQGGSTLERASNLGVWPFVFAVFAVFSKKTFFRNFYATSAVVIYLTCISLPPVAFIHSIGIPFLSTGIPTRALSIFSFCLAVLAAIGLNAFLESGKKKSLRLTLVFFSLVFLLLWAVTFVIKDPNMLISRRNLIIPTVLFALGTILLLTKLQKKITVLIIVFFATIELFYSFQKFNSFVPKAYVYPGTQIVEELRSIQGISRYWGYGNANIDANFQFMDKNYSTDGYDALFSRRYGEFLSASENGRVNKEVPRSVANIFKGYGVNDLKNNPNRIRALDLTGVKYVLNKSESRGVDSAFDEKRFKLIWTANSWQIYENKEVLLRIALFGKYMIEQDSSKIIKTLYDPKFDFHNTLILENVPSKEYNIQLDSNSLVKNVSYNSNEISLTTSSSKDQLLFVSDNYYPGWKAKVDGKKVPILRANYTFRALPVKAGTHHIKMYYSPNSFWIGFWISVSSFISLIVVSLFITMYKQHGKKT